MTIVGVRKAPALKKDSRLGENQSPQHARFVGENVPGAKEAVWF